MNADLLERLLATPGISGREERIRDVVGKELEGLVDEVRTDRLGNVLGVRKGASPRVMLCAHMDSIGFLVSHIDDDGYLRISPVGGFDPRTLVAQRVLVSGRDDYVGLLSPATKPIHLLKKEDRDKAPKIEDFFVDLMLPAEEVHRNVSIGDPITLLRQPLVTDRAVTAPYLDDRLGVFILLEALRRLKDVRAEVYAVVSVQEEVGLRGARTSTFGIDPDMGIALDITVAADLPGADKAQNPSTLGKGVSLGIMDASSISDPRLVTRFRELAEKNGITHQLEVALAGGTDAGGMQLARAGTPVITISTPTRYVHTANEMALVEDIEANIDLLARFVESAHEMDLNW
ncbi:MAG TPA: M42 family metallopeptidase [Actinomycetota bacterium]|nr:M42 family metallopeptidase [Actinomycetota bacterium]